MLIRLSLIKSFIIIASLWAILLTACDPCAECGKPLVFDPTVSLKFINRDSLLSINDSLDITNDSLTSMSERRDSLTNKTNSWESTIAMLRDSIEDGKDQYISDTVKYDDSLQTALSQISLIDTALVYTNELKDFLDDILSVIESGKVQLERVTIHENGNSQEYADSSTTYNLPLLMQDYNFTTFLIDLDGNRDTISFSYITDLEVDEERRIKMRAYNIDTVSYSYDSLLFECNTSECLSNEVLVTIYF